MHAPALIQLRQSLNDVVRGKPEVVDLALIAALARGHVLLEDVPGVGKTTLAQALARGLGCTFKRIQFTSDLLPGDILGVNIFVQQRGAFEFKPGPVFANVVLADEINRTTPKTQSSLLEAMNEGQVSIDDETRPLPDPFIVVATQNPQEYHGTYPLPESQMDRFMVRLRMGYPAVAIEREILQGRRGPPPVQTMAPVLDPARLRALQAEVDAVRVDDLVLDYLLQIVHATRRAPAVLLGASTRGALALQQACRARAFLEGRRFVLPDDVKALARAVLAHRLVMADEVDPLIRGRDEAERTIGEILEQLPVPV
ncbi:MoxR family ATPase [Myxococcota bacterium]|jgi:MoxR-like ATPase|nr:MoxR family ATPase [Myxococcota bacterium]